MNTARAINLLFAALLLAIGTGLVVAGHKCIGAGVLGFGVLVAVKEGWR